MLTRCQQKQGLSKVNITRENVSLFGSRKLLLLPIAWAASSLKRLKYDHLTGKVILMASRASL